MSRIMRSLLETNADEAYSVIADPSSGFQFNKQAYVAVTDKGTWVTVWNQAKEHEAAADHRLVSAYSLDRGKTWSETLQIEGNREGVWAAPIYVPGINRVYIFYWHDPEHDTQRDAGLLAFRYTEDEARSWSRRYLIDTPHHAIDDPRYPIHGWNFTGHLDADGVAWVNVNKLNRAAMESDVSKTKSLLKWYDTLKWTEAFLLVCPNISTERDPNKLRFEMRPEGDHGLSAPHPLNRQNTGDELSFVRLTNGQFYGTFRTQTGYPYYAISDDEGRSWSKPRPMCHTPNGIPLKQPTSACLVEKLRDGRYVFTYHNNSGDANGGCDPWEVLRNRAPLWLVNGREITAPDGSLDLEWDRPRILLANDLSKTGIEGSELVYMQLFEHGDDLFIVYSNRGEAVQVSLVDQRLLEFGMKVEISAEEKTWLQDRIEHLRSSLVQDWRGPLFMPYFHDLDRAMVEERFEEAYHLTLNRMACMIEGTLTEPPLPPYDAVLSDGESDGGKAE